MIGRQIASTAIFIKLIRIVAMETVLAAAQAADRPVVQAVRAAVHLVAVRAAAHPAAVHPVEVQVAVPVTAPLTAAVLPEKPPVPVLWTPMTTDITPSMKMMIMIGTATGATTIMLPAPMMLWKMRIGRG